MKADQRHATSKLISGYIIDNLRDPRFEVTPAFVMTEMQKLHGLDNGYHKAWRAIQLASALIRGTPEENYELLSSYLYMMTSKNSRTYTNIKIDDNNRFLYMFYAYGSSISGWNNCRPVIAVDATFLKSKFRDILMISVSDDANNQIFPLAFGIAESENNNSYEWYFSQLRNAIGSRENLIFLADRHQAIAYGIAKVYPEIHHGICIYHLEQNLKRRKVKSEVIKLFQSAARVYMCKEFDLYMSDIAKVDKKTYDYLMEEPPERGARSCSLRRRYDMLTTNIVESMNSVLLEARELPILRMIDFIQVLKLQRWFYERRNEAKGTFYDVSCWVFLVDSWRSRVEEEGITFLVDLNKRTCDGFQFQFNELPYIHAIAAIEKRNIKKSNFCSHWYLKESWLKTYERQIHPVGHTDSWIVPETVKSQIVKPLDFKVPPGRRLQKIAATVADKFGHRDRVEGFWKAGVLPFALAVEGPRSRKVVIWCFAIASYGSHSRMRLWSPGEIALRVAENCSNSCKQIWSSRSREVPRDRVEGFWKAGVLPFAFAVEGLRSQKVVIWCFAIASYGSHSRMRLWSPGEIALRVRVYGHAFA
uniref:Uncharacterized protein LOC104238962 n=1 Tax=Nicotiana sylvestris TaxID=4096 RepID=A0A1U7XXW1_NICSY|nr:PREDICTED: uncharacterized protein LOC104238962 [Nicotiana sylvestris]